jgi:Protein of unknown function (DUF4229)
MRATIQYTVIRIALFAAICAVLVLVGVNVFLAAAIAAIAALLISYFAFRGLRGKMAVEISTRGTRNARDEVITKDNDTEAEDEVLDRAENAENAERSDNAGRPDDAERPNSAGSSES